MVMIPHHPAAPSPVEWWSQQSSPHRPTCGKQIQWADATEAQAYRHGRTTCLGGARAGTRAAGQHRVRSHNSHSRRRRLPAAGLSLPLVVSRE